MIRVQIELWMDLSEELAGDFEAPSATRSLKSVDAEEGATVRDVFVALARRYQVLADRVLDPDQGVFNPNVVVLYNGRVIPRHGVEDRLLCEGDRITVLPVYAGG